MFSGGFATMPCAVANGVLETRRGAVVGPGVTMHVHLCADTFKCTCLRNVSMHPHCSFDDNSSSRPMLLYTGPNPPGRSDARQRPVG